MTIAFKTPFPARRSPLFFARRPSFAHARGAPLPGQNANGDSTRLARRTVLVVDDHQSFRDSLCGRLKGCGAVAVGADSGAAALRALEQQRDIQLALLDVSMPDVDGFTLCERIRASGAGCRIVVMSNDDTEVSRARALALGVAFVHKQELDDERLKSLVDECGGGEV